MSLNPFKQDAFGNNLILKRLIVGIFGSIAWYRFNIANHTKVTGTRVLKGLPKTRVLFVSNHQTYFADVAGMYQVFNAAKWGVFDRTNFFWSVFNPRLDVYFIAATETMKAGLLPKIFSYVGSVSIKRSWRSKGRNIDRGVDPRDINKIKHAINNGWVVTFPQGTTTPFVPGRKGTAHIIKELKPIVIPVVIDGFRRAFDKKGLFLKMKDVELTIRFKDPLMIDYNGHPTAIMNQIMDAIEQSKDYLLVPQAQEEES
jgi:1-acyl-sn-glycerol-3-phosphate acyltransferase